METEYQIMSLSAYTFASSHVLANGNVQAYSSNNPQHMWNIQAGQENGTRTIITAQCPVVKWDPANEKFYAFHMISLLGASWSRFVVNRGRLYNGQKDKLIGRTKLCGCKTIHYRIIYPAIKELRSIQLYIYCAVQSNTHSYLNKRVFSYVLFVSNFKAMLKAYPLKRLESILLLMMSRL